jgi:hypothetical protein
MDQFGAGTGGAAGGQQVVDDQHPWGVLKAIGEDLQPIAAVFEAVIHANHRPRQLARLAHRAEADALGGGQGGADDEAPRLNANDQVGLEAITHVPQLTHHLAPGLHLPHQRRDVTKQDSGLGKVGDIPHQLAKIDRGHGRRIDATAGSIAAMSDSPAPASAPASPARALSRRGVERLDLLLLCAEALDLNGGEAMVWLSEEMGFTHLFPNRVELWKRRCYNPLRRTTRRGVLQEQETDALIRILNALADRLYPMVRSLLSSAEPPQITAQRWLLFRSRLEELIRERFNLRRGAVQNLLDPEQGQALCHQLIQAMALSAGPGGFDRLKASLMDAA